MPPRQYITVQLFVPAALSATHDEARNYCCAHTPKYLLLTATRYVSRRQAEPLQANVSHAASAGIGGDHSTLSLSVPLNLPLPLSPLLPLPLSFHTVTLRLLASCSSQTLGRSGHSAGGCLQVAASCRVGQDVSEWAYKSRFSMTNAR